MRDLWRKLYPASPVNKQHFSKMIVGNVVRYSVINVDTVSSLRTLLRALPEKIIELSRSHKKQLEFLAHSYSFITVISVNDPNRKTLMLTMTKY